jgi:hypothetical protein
MDMRVSPRRSVLASVAAGCCLAASVVAGGYAASGAMPFSEWPGAVFASGRDAEVALAPAERAAAPVVALPAPAAQEEARTQVIPIDDVEQQGAAPAAGDGDDPPAARERRTTRRSTERTREPDTSPTTAPADSAPQATETAAAPAPATPAPTPVARAARRLKLNNPTATFASASTSGSGQPELTVQMAVADEAQAAATPKTVALNLKLAPTDVQALVRTAAAVKSSKIALETEVDVVDATVAAAGQPACADATCLRVQMKFAPDTRENPADEPEVQVLEEGTSLSNKVKVVVQIDADAIGGMRPTAPAEPEPAPDAGAPTVLALPLPALDDPAAPPAAPASDTATVTLPDADANPGTPDAPSVQIQAQLEVIETPALPEPPAAEAPATEPTAAAQPVAAEPAAQDCPPGQE